MRNLSAIVLAAGKGTRMKSEIPKVLHGIAGRPMLFYPIKVLKELGAKKVIAVIGYGGSEVKGAFASAKITFIEQKRQLGTGHAVMCASKALKGFKGDVLVLSGDVPLITGATVKGLFKVYRDSGAVISLITAVLKDPDGYGRVIRGKDNAVTGIVEDKDCTPEEKNIREVNSGIYLISSDFLLKNIKKLGSQNAQGEYYLPDLVHMAVKQGRRASALTHIDPDEVMGVNNRIELAKAGRVMRGRIIDELMLNGVTIVDPDTAYIDSGVKVGRDTVIHPSVFIEGDTVIGGNCVIEQGVTVRNSLIGANSSVKAFSVIESSLIGKDASIGPFARLRPGNVIADRVRIGNFVEVKKTRIGKGTKANHLTYLGDSVIGTQVNIGAGTITCNYDGLEKHTTVIEDGAFIGSDSQLIAPVKVGKFAYVGSGTTVTKDVPPGALVITRAEEKVIEGWVKKTGRMPGQRVKKKRHIKE